MPGDYTLNLDWPTCSIDHQKCPSYLSRCDRCSDRKRRIRQQATPFQDSEVIADLLGKFQYHPEQRDAILEKYDSLLGG